MLRESDCSVRAQAIWSGRYYYIMNTFVVCVLYLLLMESLNQGF
jgi:hypothetical protein